MSDEEQQTYSAREIVLEFFPATHERLIPGFDDYRLEPRPHGQLAILGRGREPLLYLSPIAVSGSASAQLCCDFCQRSAPRHYLQPFRVEVPGSEGRRYRYISLCRDATSCALRRFDDEAIRALLSRLFR